MPQQNRSFTVMPALSGYRLDKALADLLRGDGVSRSAINQWIRAGRVELNNEPASSPSRKVQEGDRIELWMEAGGPALQARPGQLDVLWEDDDVALINKPAGLSAHPTSSGGETTLSHLLLHRYPQLAGPDPLRPGIVHRLDKETTGLMLIGLSPRGRERLSRDFAERRVHKEYLALVNGLPREATGRIDAPLGRDPDAPARMAVVSKNGKEAVSSYEVLASFPERGLSLLRVAIHTGRTHQIRVHLAEIGHPLVGDRVYGPKAHAELKLEQPRLARLATRQMLHAWRLAFLHPVSKERLSFSQAVPKDFYRLLLQAFVRLQRVGVTGAVGSGKTALTRLISRDKIPRWSADEAVSELYAPGEDGWEMLRRTFGDRFVPDESAPVDKERLFAAMIESQELREEILEVVHPLVRHRLERFWRQQADRRVALAEIPLLVEAGWQESKAFDAVVGIFCPDRRRKDWLRQNRGWSDSMISRMEAWQLPQGEKLRSVGLPVDNSGDWASLAEKARQVRSALLWLRRRRLSRFLHWLHGAGVL